MGSFGTADDEVGIPSFGAALRRQQKITEVFTGTPASLFRHATSDGPPILGNSDLSPVGSAPVGCVSVKALAWVPPPTAHPPPRWISTNWMG